MTLIPAGWKWKPGPWYVAGVVVVCLAIAAYGVAKSRQT